MVIDQFCLSLICQQKLLFRANKWYNTRTNLIQIGRIVLVDDLKLCISWWAIYDYNLKILSNDYQIIVILRLLEYNNYYSSVHLYHFYVVKKCLPHLSCSSYWWSETIQTRLADSCLMVFSNPYTLLCKH